jgi:hypothetical protein
MDVKAAIIFLKEELKTLAEQQKKGKHAHKYAQRQLQKLIIDNKMNPYQEWSWMEETTDGKQIYWIYGSEKAVLKSSFGEKPEEYKRRLDLWLEFVKTTGYNHLPTVYWGDAWVITCHHILFNKLCGGKPHIEKDEEYVNSPSYKALVERIEKQFPLQDEFESGNNATK